MITVTAPAISHQSARGEPIRTEPDPAAATAAHSAMPPDRSLSASPKGMTAVPRWAAHGASGPRPTDPSVPASLPSHSPVHAVIGGAGRPLDAISNAYFSYAFRTDFRDVRIHDDGLAAQSAAHVDAAAYTVGRHIVLGAGAGSPGSAGRDQLLAHELTHVVQQRGSRIGLDRSLLVGAVDDPAEHAADAAAAAVMSGLTAGHLPDLGPVARVQRVVQKECRAPSGWLMPVALTNPTLIPSAIAAAAAFGLIAETFISADVVARTGVLPGNFYLDNPLAGPIDPAYVAFILAKNPGLSLLQAAAVAASVVVRPDVLIHQPPLTEFEEVKPDSRAGRTAGRAKVRGLNAFYTRFTLPYVGGTTYIPRPPFVICSGIIPGTSTPFTATFEIKRDRAGLLVYDICIETDFLVAAAFILVLVALIILAILAAGAVTPVPVPAPPIPVMAQTEPGGGDAGTATAQREGPAEEEAAAEGPQEATA